MWLTEGSVTETATRFSRAARTVFTSWHTVRTGEGREDAGETDALDEAPPVPVPPGELPPDPQAAARSVTAQRIAPPATDMLGVTRLISQ
jgi:hypothetical protein